MVYVEKGMLCSLSPARVQNTANRKIIPFEAHMQEKNAIYCIFTGFCEHTRSKAPQDRHPIFPSKCHIYYTGEENAEFPGTRSRGTSFLKRKL